MNKIHPYTTETFQPLHAAQKLEAPLRDGRIAFEAVTEDHSFYDEEGRTEAVISTISYLRTDDENSQRPVMFLWNGGPGSAVSMLQLECFGPYCIARDEEKNPIYGLEIEADTILDLCDLVYMDPVGVGYSRLFRDEAAKHYFSVDGDARSIAFAIVSWLKKHQRWNSPVYLCGESYGTIRACRVLDELGRNPFYGNRMMLGVPVAGVILIGSALSVGKSGNELIDPALELVTAALPSMAAVNWYHNHQEDEERNAFVEAAWTFGRTRLLPALFAGDDCSLEEIKELAAELAKYTGMDAAYFENSRLKLRTLDDFMTQVVRHKERRVDLYDGRVTSPLAGVYNMVGDGNIPLSVMNGILTPKLGVDTQRIYYTGNLNVYPDWNYTAENGKSHMDCLREAAERMPDMKIFMASGLYDLCTLAGNTRYQFSHSGIAYGRVVTKEYPGGHGVYSSKEGKAAFLQDVRSMIKE
ncbi:S10 family serine carboxypeptidase-like protein [Ihubacter sp. rT4E-8]|uniref:S10 family serine carboxypeptidase-like protein n=1 Tax=Anaerovoracaceae TaxID=543314 RepID=UPI00203D2981